MEFKDKIMLYCSGDVKYNQGFTIEIRYYLYNALGLIFRMFIDGQNLKSQTQQSQVVSREMRL